MLIRSAWVIARKDLTLLFGIRGTSHIQAVLLGLLLIFLFSLSAGADKEITAQAASTIFWMASCFSQILIFSALYAQEETNGQRIALLLSPIPTQAIWLGKAFAGFCMLFCSQIIFFFAILVFLGQPVASGWPNAFAIMCIADIGITASGSLLGALSQGKSVRESLFSIILFPMLTPLLLAAIQIGSCAFTPLFNEDISSWFGTALAFDSIFLAAGLLLFPYIFTAED